MGAKGKQYKSCLPQPLIMKLVVCLKIAQAMDGLTGLHATALWYYIHLCKLSTLRLKLWWFSAIFVDSSLYVHSCASIRLIWICIVLVE